jgi:hypothetical protein
MFTGKFVKSKKKKKNPSFIGVLYISTLRLKLLDYCCLGNRVFGGAGAVVERVSWLNNQRQRRCMKVYMDQSEKRVPSLCQGKNVTGFYYI